MNHKTELPTGDGVEIVTFDEDGWKTHILSEVDELQREVSRRGLRTADEAMSSVRDIAAQNDEVKGLFPCTAWGQIVWQRSVGLPQTPRVKDAFLLIHRYEFLDWVIGPDGVPIAIGGWVDAGFPPKVWDGPNDEAHYRVSFMLHGISPFRNGFGIGLKPGVQWQPAAPPWFTEPRRIVPWSPDGIFLIKSNEILQLPETRVYLPFP